MSANDGGSIVTPAPRLVRKSAGFLRDRLEQGEGVVFAYRVRTGSILVSIAAGFGVLILGSLLVNFLFRGRETSAWHDVAYFFGYTVTLFWAIQLQKQRVLALTDRRLFLLKTHPFVERVQSIESEERRASVHATLLSKKRVEVSGDGHLAARVIASGSPMVIQYLMDWAAPSRPDA